jgi:single-stranded DNA-binding protein
MSSTPKYVELKNGERWANFTLSTSENYIDKHGNTQHKLYWHRACAWGQSLKLLEEFGKPGMGMCIEGELWPNNKCRVYKYPLGSDNLPLQI